MAYAEVKEIERKESAAAFLLSVLRRYRRLGLRVSGVMTDNATAFQSGGFQKVLRWLGLARRATRPYTPRTNGKVGCFIRSLLNAWAYAYAYRSSDEREARLPEWLHDYNRRRPHSRPNNQAPVSRLGLGVNNLVRPHNWPYSTTAVRSVSRIRHAFQQAITFLGVEFNPGFGFSGQNGKSGASVLETAPK